jgi:proline iminopeptidase
MRVNVGDIELHVREEVSPGGHGRPIVLLHGGPGLDGSVWFPEISALVSDGFRILAVDQRANGRSDFGSESSWTLQQFAADVEALIRVLSLDNPIVFGWSFGSFVAQQHMADFGTAAAYVLMGTIASLDALSNIGERLAAFEPEHLREQVTASWEREPFCETQEEFAQLMSDQMPWQCGDPESPVVAKLQARANEPVYSPRILRHFSASGDYGFIDNRERFRTFNKPVLVLNGALDRTTPASSACELAEVLPLGEYAEIPNTGHMVLDEAPLAAITALRSFFVRV